MGNASVQNQEISPPVEDAELMAIVLEGRHGTYAAEVADFFALLHRQLGDKGRSRAWGGVAQLVRRRERDRVLMVQ